MIFRCNPFAFVVLWISVVITASGAEPQYFVDDFENGSITDFSPVSWMVTTSVFPAEATVVEGNLQVTPTHSYPIGWSGFEVANATYRDVSLTTQVPGSGVVFPYLFARKRGSFFGPGPLVVGGIEYGQESPSTLFLSYQGTPTELLRIPVDWLESGADIELRLDVIADQAFLTAWSVDQPQPATPQLSIFLPNGPADEGTAGVLALNLAEDPRPAIFPNLVPRLFPNRRLLGWHSLACSGCLYFDAQPRRCRLMSVEVSSLAIVSQTVAPQC